MLWNYGLMMLQLRQPVNVGRQLDLAVVAECLPALITFFRLWIPT
jgi:hypothetical protein